MHVTVMLHYTCMQNTVTCMLHASHIEQGYIICILLQLHISSLFQAKMSTFYVLQVTKVQQKMSTLFIKTIHITQDSLVRSPYVVLPQPNCSSSTINLCCSQYICIYVFYSLRLVSGLETMYEPHGIMMIGPQTLHRASVPVILMTAAQPFYQPPSVYIHTPCDNDTVSSSCNVCTHTCCV